MAKYDPLRDHLKTDGSPLITLSFATIAGLVGGLPESASDHRSWWSNQRGSSRGVHARSWREAGYFAEPDLLSRLVLFRRG